MLALAATRILGSILYGVDVRDPLLFASTSAGIAVVAALASYAPAQRATTIDPIVSLRSE